MVVVVVVVYNMVVTIGNGCYTCYSDHHIVVLQTVRC